MANPSMQTLLQTAKKCHKFLDAVDIPHVVIGGLAVYLHGYDRNSRDVDLLVCRDDWSRIQQAFESAQYVWCKRRSAYYSPGEVRVRVDFLLYGGEDPGKGEVPLPDPAADQTYETINSLPVLALPHLIEAKLACAREKKPRKKQHYQKHREDVAELIIAKKLTGSYADDLHESVRAEFRKLVAQAGAP